MDLQDMIKDVDFQARLYAFLDRNVLQGFLNKEDFGIEPDRDTPEPDAPNERRLCTCQECTAAPDKAKSIKTHVLSKRPPNPARADFRHIWVDRCNKLAEKTQVHSCYGDPDKRTGCYTITDSDNNPVCKSGFDEDGNKPLIPATGMTDKGELQLKRSHPRVNNYNPAMIAVLRSNMDIKIVLSGLHAYSLIM
jgi:hypothetical protein